ncbi:MAG TPA: SDR family NAD(P)-dependent oxidoreductase [Phototrophicaceae bacterium]|nr:SDR family NAD(P)-dependent oxidoreductase [Phototrophicaceae bacterium]
MSQVVLITGASSGIGYATALAFAQRGAQIAATARRSDKLADLANEIAALKGECLTISADVTDAAAMQAAVAQTVARFGRLDVLIANAGVGQRGTLVDSEWGDLETVLRTNIDGVLHSVRAAIPALRATKGQIVLVASLAGTTPAPYTAVYGASKAFVRSLGCSLEYELQPDGIAVTTLLIGPVATEFSANRKGAAGHGAQAANIPSMSAAQVAAGIVKAVERRSKTVVLRLFDRLILLGNLLVPDVIGRQAVKRYKD